MFQEIHECRCCGSVELVEVFSLKNMPLADGLLSEDALTEEEPRFPLTMLFCRGCSLAQLRETVTPELLFGGDYPYYSSFSDDWLRHCRENALELIESRQLDESSQVVELACNDGYMLRNFQERKIPVFGVEPAAGPAAAAQDAGIPVVQEFFTRLLAEQLRGDGVRADVILGNNVLAHVADLSGFVDGVRLLLKESGVAVFEVPYVKDLIENSEFDTIYHEHLCYFSVHALCELFDRHGLSLNHVRRLPTHGGSLRLYVERRREPSETLQTLLAEEQQQGMCEAEYYRSFAGRVADLRENLRELLGELKRSGKRLAAYAAAAKGVTLLNAFDIGRDVIDFVVDRNRHKHGKFIPGVRLPVYDTSQLLEAQPDYVLLLAWNLRDEILRQQSEYRRRGGRFVVPIPWPAIAD